MGMCDVIYRYYYKRISKNNLRYYYIISNYYAFILTVINYKDKNYKAITDDYFKWFFFLIINRKVIKVLNYFKYFKKSYKSNLINVYNFISINYQIYLKKTGYKIIEKFTKHYLFKSKKPKINNEKNFKKVMKSSGFWNNDFNFFYNKRGHFNYGKFYKETKKIIKNI